MLIKVLKWQLGILLVLVLCAALYLEAQYKEDIPVEAIKKEFATKKSKYVHYDGAAVHYQVSGKGPTIVLIHGFGGNTYNWRHWQEMLSDSFKVISVDLPGFGITGPITSGNYSDSAQVAFLEAFVDSLKLKHFVLAGNSMGGAISWKYAAKNPDKVKELILINASGYPSINSGKKRPLAFRLLDKESLRPFLTKITPESVIKKTLLNTYFQDSLVTKEEVNLYVKMLVREGNREVILNRSKNGSSRPDTTLLSTLPMRTLILWGDQDNVISVANAYRFERDIPDNKLIIYENVGHLPMFEDPIATTRDLRAFLAEK